MAVVVGAGRGGWAIHWTFLAVYACFVEKHQYRSFRIIGLVENSRQIIGFTGLTCKTFRNNDLTVTSWGPRRFSGLPSLHAEAPGLSGLRTVWLRNFNFSI